MKSRADETVSFLTSETEKFVGRLEQFETLLSEAKDKAISSSLDESFGKSLDKVEALKGDVRDGRLKIALVGAFSDGKTSTVAGFLGHADANMKIAEEESSDEIVEYAPRNIDADVPPCVFVDTPGLFGRKFSKKTEDWISQAHLILYIVSAANPLKDSHRDTVAWLLKKLKKFDNTIFVINMMDKVCDYTDDEDFEGQKEAKKRFLKENVARFCDFAPDDPRLDGLNIVCIASDPDGRGLQVDGRGHENYWLTEEHRGDYEDYSRMEDLRKTVNDVVRNTFAERLIRNSALEAIMDMTRNNCESLREESLRLDEAVIPEVERTIKTLKMDFSDAQRDIRREVRPCREELLSLEKSICDKLRNVGMDDFKRLFEDEVGGGDEPGYKLQGMMKDIVSDHFGGLVTRICERIVGDFEVGGEHIDTALGMVKSGAKTIGGLAKGVNKTMIFAGRDLLGKIGIVIKFKPWQAAKFANFASKGIPAIGAAVSLIADVWSMAASAAAQKKFDDMKQTLVASIQGAFKEVYDILNDDRLLFTTFAPQIAEIESQIVDADRHLVSLRNMEEYCKTLEEKLQTFWKISCRNG
ncbi:MAG: 50S ribosome-binding GTPase [Kiritimatiellae bacterium]|nr:50S ribosome-binding GTPase [Kiritimatiellia bacterium]